MQNVPFQSFQHFLRFLFADIDRKQCHRDRGTAVILGKAVPQSCHPEGKNVTSSWICKHYNVSRHNQSIQTGGLLLLMKQYSAKDTGVYWVHQSFSEHPVYSTQF